MAFRHGLRKNWYFDGKLRVGVKQLCTYTPDKRLANRIEHMWSELAERHRAWDLLDPVLADTRSIGVLYDAWVETKHDVEAMRRRQADTDIEVLVDEWDKVYRKQTSEDHAQHALVHVRYLFPAGERCMVSRVQPDWLTMQLTDYPGEQNTRRKVHSSWTAFFKYATTIKRMFPVNPMEHVERPKLKEGPIRFYESEDVEAIVAWQPTAQRQCLMALLYGAAIEVSTALQLTREDFYDIEAQEVRSAGTKTHTRDRVSRIDDWAWPTVWAYIRDMLPGTPLFAGVTRSGANFWHRQAISLGMYDTTGALLKPALGLKHQYPMHNARHAWAVRFLRGGGPIVIAQHQLGHASPTMTLKRYGRFMPSASDRKKWSQQAAKYDLRRRSAAQRAPAVSRSG